MPSCVPEEEEEEGKAEFRGAAGRALCQGQGQAARAVPGSAAPAARIPTTKSTARTLGRLCLSPPRRGEDTGTLVTPGTTSPSPACPSRPARSPPGPAPGATEPRTAPGPTSERHRRLLCYFAFVVTRRRVPVPVVPSPCPPPRPSHSPPQAASPRSGRDICQRDGATPLPAPGRGRSAEGISGGISGVPARGHSG
ncbi:translation initiation factor IF-2-like [Melozone crissalis]|uniref:translation initiation factor IF-2-like n=1 Tax=Melozone crissalis TaxID=40204 RepID=UPI0023DBBD67|nr:translation initiation factor IF-2-like [Melozone crissalis]